MNLGNSAAGRIAKLPLSVLGGFLFVVLLANVAGAETSQHEPAGQHAVAGGHSTEAHAGAGSEEHHQDFNWFQGFLGAREGVEPSVLWRTPDMPPPFGSMLLNTALLIGLFVKLGTGPVIEGLKKRRTNLVKDIDEASAMEAEAREQLSAYRAKLDNLDSEIERVKRDMSESAEAERKRALQEADARRERLVKEARTLVQQELDAMQERLTRETSRAALDSARRLLRAQVSSEDERRLRDGFLVSLPSRSAIDRSSKGAS